VGSDRSQLANTAKAAKEAIGTETLEAVADRGYFNGEEIKTCVDDGITVTLPKPMTSSAKAEGPFGKEEFRVSGRTPGFDMFTRPRPTADSATPVLGGQAAVSLAAIYVNSSADINGTLSGTLGPIPFSRAFDVSDSRDAFGDLFPQFALRWNSGVNNWMTYLTGDIPVGAYALTAMAIGNQFAIYAAPNIKDQVEIHFQEGDQMTPRAEACSSAAAKRCRLVRLAKAKAATILTGNQGQSSDLNQQGQQQHVLQEVQH